MLAISSLSVGCRNIVLLVSFERSLKNVYEFFFFFVVLAIEANIVSSLSRESPVEDWMLQFLEK